MNRAFAQSALKGALLATAFAAVVALTAGMIRIFPWLLDPSVTWRVATPFARSLTILALEAAVAVGWPVGWALAVASFIEQGDARVLRLLGEPPARTVLRLGPQAVLFAIVLGCLSWGSARESTEPGRVVTELIAEGEAACGSAPEARTYVVPFFGATWLCAPVALPRLVGAGPGPLSRLVFSARHARASGDLGSIDLDDAHLAVASPNASLHVDELHVSGAAPWGHASSVPPVLRGLALGSAAPLAALLTVLLLLGCRPRGRLVALVVGASGPLVALGFLRFAERLGPMATPLVGLTPIAAMALPLALVTVVARLPGSWHAGSKSTG